jgi:filamentous hemagglutinin
MQGFSSALLNTVVNLTLADVQFEIGNVFNDTNGNPINGGEGSLGHVLLHGLAGCVAAEAQGADCAAGAAGGIAGAIYSGMQKAPERGSYASDAAYQAAYNSWHSQTMDQAQLVSLAAGYLFSGGKAENVSVGTSVGTSAVANNYLYHAEAQEKASLKDFLAQCDGAGGCTAQERLQAETRLNEIETLDKLRDAMLASACQANRLSSACLAGIRDAQLAVNSYLGTSDGFSDRLWEDNAKAGRILSAFTGFGSDPALAAMLNGMDIGSAGGAAVAALFFGGPATARCAMDAFCRAEVAKLAVDAVGTQFTGQLTMFPVAGGAMLTLVAGGKVIGLLDEANNLTYKAVGQSAAGRYLVETTAGIGYVDEAGRVVSRADIVAMPKLGRPDPTAYLSQAEIDAHLSLFSSGAVRVTPTVNISKYGTAGPDGGFVLPKSELARIMQETGGDAAKIERALGLNAGDLTSGQVSILEIAPEHFVNLRIASGNEGGANANWIPGGYTSGGVPEAVMDLSSLSSDKFIVLDITP